MNTKVDEIEKKNRKLLMFLFGNKNSNESFVLYVSIFTIAIACAIYIGRYINGTIN